MEYFFLTIFNDGLVGVTFGFGELPEQCSSRMCGNHGWRNDCLPGDTQLAMYRYFQVVVHSMTILNTMPEFKNASSGNVQRTMAFLHDTISKETTGSHFPEA